MNRIAFITLGCKLNYAETSTYERALLKEGFEAVPWTKGADVFVVNTCTVTEHSDKKSRNIIRKLHRQNPEAQIYVTGWRSASIRSNRKKHGDSNHPCKHKASSRRQERPYMLPRTLPGKYRDILPSLFKRRKNPFIPESTGRLRLQMSLLHSALRPW